MKKPKNGKVIIPSGAHPWPHELRVAYILADAGHIIEFIPEGSLKSADIYLDGSLYEIKSPLTSKPDKLERNIKRALKQARNVIFDSSRIKGLSDRDLCRFLTNKVKTQRQIGSLLLITKRGQIIDIRALI